MMAHRGLTHRKALSILSALAAGLLLRGTVAHSATKNGLEKRLQATVWVLDSLPSGLRIPLPLEMSFVAKRGRIEKGIFAGSPCNTFHLSHSVQGTTIRFSNAKITKAGCTIGPEMIQEAQGDLFFQKEPMRFQLTKNELLFNTLRGSFRFVPASQWNPPPTEQLEMPVVVRPWKDAVGERQGTWSLESVVVNVGSRFRYPDDAWTMTITDNTYVLQHPCGAINGTLDPDTGAFQPGTYLACARGAPQRQTRWTFEDSGLLVDGRLLLRDARTEVTWKHIAN
jgi:hypothetical protein